MELINKLIILFFDKFTCFLIYLVTMVTGVGIARFIYLCNWLINLIIDLFTWYFINLSIFF